MNFNLVNIASADIPHCIGRVEQVILNPLIGFMFALALVYFLYGLVEFIINRDSDDKRTQGKSHMLWGIVGMFIMVAAFGIINLIKTTIGA